MEFLSSVFRNDEYVSQNTYMSSNIEDEHFNSIFKKDDLEAELAPVYNLQPLPCDCIVGKDVKNDLEVFHPYDNSTYSGTIHHTLNHTHTNGGSLFLADLLDTPQCSPSLLSLRQQCLKELESLSNSTQDASTDESVKLWEKDAIWFFSQKDAVVEQFTDLIFFKSYFFRRLNKSDKALSTSNLYKIAVSPSIGILSPIMYVVIPFIILRIKFKNIINISFTTYIKLLMTSIMNSSSILNAIEGRSGKSMGVLSIVQIASYIMSFVFYFQGIFNSIELSKTSYNVCKFISNKVNNLMKFLKYSLDLMDLYEPIITKYEGVFVKDDATSTLTSDTNNHTQQLIRNYKPYDEFTMFSNFGHQLSIFKTICKDDVLALINRSYYLDCLLGIVRSKRVMNLCYPVYSEKSEARIDGKGLWHPALKLDTCVQNDIQASNIIVTGPNAGGKSTFIKALCLSVYMAQTIGMSASEHLTLTPFYFLNTQINIPDCKGQESLFEAEMNRCLYNLQTIETCCGKTCLVVMDEIFNSTNIIEAVAGAYSILEKMASFKNCVSVITTHFSYLTKLRKESIFKCYRMNVIYDDEGKIIYPYKIEPGVSKQYVALELLKHRGFETDIIDRAVQIKNKFVK